LVLFIFYPSRHGALVWSTPLSAEDDRRASSQMPRDRDRIGGRAEPPELPKTNLSHCVDELC
jgi:hypothetical protein